MRGEEAFDDGIGWKQGKENYGASPSTPIIISPPLPHDLGTAAGAQQLGCLEAGRHASLKAAAGGGDGGGEEEGWQQHSNMTLHLSSVFADA